MNVIGGYFELEINSLGSVYHDDCIALNSAMNAFEHILLCKKIKHIYIPYFTCDVMLEPLIRNNITYTFYHIDENFFPVITNINLRDSLLYTNYFGINQYNINKLSKLISNLIIDNAQAFYDKPLLGVPTIYSPRKFFGIPDGGFVYHANEIDINGYPNDSSIERMQHLLFRVELGAEAGYEYFKQNDEKLNNQPIRKMSQLTRKILSGINFESIKEKRIANFYLLHNELKNTNSLTNFIDDAQFDCPMVYPYWVNDASQLRDTLHKNKIFTAQYWPNVLKWLIDTTFESECVMQIIYLPIDQRISFNDIERIKSICLNK